MPVLPIAGVALPAELDAAAIPLTFMLRLTRRCKRTHRMLHSDDEGDLRATTWPTYAEA